MVDIGCTKMGPEGKIIIPKEMRGNLKKGEELLITKKGSDIILEKLNL